LFDAKLIYHQSSQHLISYQEKITASNYALSHAAPSAAFPVAVVVPVEAGVELVPNPGSGFAVDKLFKE